MSQQSFFALFRNVVFQPKHALGSGINGVCMKHKSMRNRRTNVLMLVQAGAGESDHSFDCCGFGHAVALDVLVLWTMRAFHSVNRVAGWLMLPYFAWAIFATFLNMVIWHMNRDIRSSDTGSGVTWSTARRPDTRDGYSEW